MPKASPRPSLPTSSSDFALPPSSSVASTSILPEDANPLFLRFRRPSTLAAPKATYLTETRLHSPLVASFTHRRRGSMFTEESESDRERMWADSSPSSSSENPTPPLGPMDNGDDTDRNVKRSSSTRPPTPPRKQSFNLMDTQESSSRPNKRRLSFPLRPPRIINLLAESRPEEVEVKSEAAFQRLVTSCSELPTQPRTPRNTSDRGRYPEEVVEEENQREDNSSDDGDGDDAIFAFLPSGSEPISIGKPSTPVNSVSGDDSNMWIPESPGCVAMDVDSWFGSPSVAPASAPTQWRYTPPPTSAVRSNKRKFDDRYDPYPTASKRRAVSPSISYLRETHLSLVSPILNARTVSGAPRLPMSVPISIPGSAVNSATSSPTITGSYPISGISLSRPASITSSPILRAQMGLASPILRPVPRRREEREIEGAGEAVGGLTLG